jgi:hypothetical protein
MPLPLLLVAGDTNLPVSSTSEGSTRREEQCGKRVSACMHLQFAFCSQIESHPLLVKTVHLLIRLLMPLPLLLLAGDNNLPVLSMSKGATKREGQRATG